jgi:hypothetical protein
VQEVQIQYLFIFGLPIMRMHKTMIFLAGILVFAAGAFGQTSSFNYQGKLTDGGSPANGSFLLQFKLFDAPSGGSQIGSTLSDIALTAASGVFTVDLDSEPRFFRERTVIWKLLSDITQARFLQRFRPAGKSRPRRTHTRPKTLRTLPARFRET